MELSPGEVNGLQPWERQPSETDEAWLAFRAYRDQRPPRRMYKVSVNGVRMATETALSYLQANNWPVRVAAFDRHLDDELRKEREAILKQDQREVLARQKALLADVHELCELETQKYLEASKTSQAPGMIRPGDIARLAELAIKLQRLIAGETTEKIETKSDFSGLSVEELRELEKIRKKMSGGV